MSSSTHLASGTADAGHRTLHRSTRRVQLEALTLTVAQGKLDIDALAIWFRQRLRVRI